MNFIDWMNMNMFVDIAFLVFAIAVVWKFKKLQKYILLNQDAMQHNKQENEKHNTYSQKLSERIDLQSSVIIEMGQNVSSLRDDLELTMRNPAAAKRTLKDRR
jgi:hypothetical protein